MSRLLHTAAFAISALLLASACGKDENVACCAIPEKPDAATSSPTPTPTISPVNGWREHPLAPGVIRIQAAKPRIETIKIPVPKGGELEYKLGMKKGDAIVYSINYGDLSHPGLMVVEFHGHTEKVDGVGDLMFYSKTGGSEEHGQFTAPWDGIHGWYLKNDSGKNVVATLEVAGFYERLDQKSK